MVVGMVVIVIMVVVMIMVVIVVLVAAEIRLERSLDLRGFHAGLGKRLLELWVVLHAQEPLADLDRHVPVAQEVGHGGRFLGRRRFYMEQLFGLGGDLVNLAVLAGRQIAMVQRLALGQAAPG